MKRQKRTDCHRVGAIIPRDYEHVMHYSLATTDDGWPIPSLHVNCVDDRATRSEHGAIIKPGEHDEDGMCCLVGLRSIACVKFASHGTTGKCTVCGSHFIYGEIWKHVPTGEHVHIGHICSGKYGLLADYSEFELAHERWKRARATELKKKKNKEDREDFLSKNQGLEEALEADHYIVRDIKRRFVQYCSLSDKQIELVFELSKMSDEPEEQEEKYVQAPEGRQTFEGVVVGTKSVESQWGTTRKMIVKMTTDDGVWLAYGTIPSGCSTYDSWGDQGLRGKSVRVTGTLTRSDRDDHFSFFKRPKGELI